MVKMHFLARVEEKKDNSWIISVNSSCIHKFPENNSATKIVESDTELPIGSYIYAYDAELNNDTRVMIIRGFTIISNPINPSYKQEVVQGSPEITIENTVVEMITDPGTYPNGITSRST